MTPARNSGFHPLGWLALALLTAWLPATAAAEAGVEPLQWVRGPGTGLIGDDLAQIELGPDSLFLDQAETQRLLEMTGNPVSGIERATIASASDQESWFVIFEYDEIGYVEDSDADDLDPQGILDSIRAGTAEANEERARRGWSPIEIVGWHEEPHYDPQTNNLTWAIIGESSEGRTINRMVKLLGRRGVMTATLVSSQAELPVASAKVDAALAGYSFHQGSRYAEFVPGKDRIAEIGLAALIAGGAGAVLVKSGLLARIWKVLVALGVAVVGGISRLFGRGRREAESALPT